MITYYEGNYCIAICQVELHERQGDTLCHDEYDTSGERCTIFCLLLPYATNKLGATIRAVLWITFKEACRVR